MGNFKGEFLKTKSSKLGLPIVSFVLTNSNLFVNETINILISDTTGTKRRSMRLELQKGLSYRFDIDTIGWDWAQYDIFSIIDNSGRIIQQWQCRMPEYDHISCPHCHGTKKCRFCNGEGVSLTANYQVLTCSACGGTGICQYCDVPVRNVNSLNVNSDISYGSPSNGKGRSIAAIQGDIRKTELELQRVNRLLLDYELRQDYGIFYSSQKRYALSLEHKIRDLYNEMSRSM